MHGEVRCPELGLPGSLQELGRKLGEFCKVDPNLRPRRREQLLLRRQPQPAVQDPQTAFWPVADLAAES